MWMSTRTPSPSSAPSSAWLEAGGGVLEAIVDLERQCRDQRLGADDHLHGWGSAPARAAGWEANAAPIISEPTSQRRRTFFALNVPVPRGDTRLKPGERLRGSQGDDRRAVPPAGAHDRRIDATVGVVRSHEAGRRERPRNVDRKRRFPSNQRAKSRTGSSSPLRRLSPSSKKGLRIKHTWKSAGRALLPGCRT